jgi:hypothetical protein
MSEATIDTIFTGRARVRWEGRAPSAVGKDPCERPLRLT